MKRGVFIVAFIVLHVLFVALKIDKQSKTTQLSYEKQRLEKEYSQLVTQKKQLTQQLYNLQNLDTIKKIALQQGLEPIKLSSVKRITKT